MKHLALQNSSRLEKCGALISSYERDNEVDFDQTFEKVYSCFF